MTTFRFEEHDPDDRDTGPDYFLRHPGRERADAERNETYASGDDRRPDPDEAKGKGGCLRRVWWLVLILVGVACGTCYVRYFVPHTSDSAMRCRVTSLERHGIIFKVYEAQLKDAGEGGAVRVSVPSDSLAALLSAAMEHDAEVCVVTEKYFAPVPWRGETSTVVTAVKP